MKNKLTAKEKQKINYLKWFNSKGRITQKLYRDRPDIKRKHKKYMKIYGKTLKCRLGIRRYLDNQKRLVYEHYSNSKHPKCIKCGFDDMRALSVDHMKGNGHKHRIHMKLFGNAFYRWLIKNNYPKDYQILCMNCQFIKRYTNKEIPERTRIVK